MRDLFRAIVLADVTRGYSGRGQRVSVFRGLQLAVTCGERVALVGPNGSGKSTLLRLIAGLLRTDAGIVRVRDSWGGLVDPAHTPGTCAAVFEGGRSLHGRLTLGENVQYAAALDGQPADGLQRSTQSILDRLGLAAHRDDLAQSLSKGSQQKVAIAIAMARRRSILLLDEPTTLLDEPSCKELAILLHELTALGQTVVVATHDHAWRTQLDARCVSLAVGTRGTHIEADNAGPQSARLPAARLAT